MRERTLYLQVLDYDRFSRNDPIGEVSIPLNKVELGQIKTFWKELKPCSDGSVREREGLTIRSSVQIRPNCSFHSDVVIIADATHCLLSACELDFYD